MPRSDKGTDEWQDGESTEPFPSPRGLAPHSFQAGLLARRHPPPAPSHASVSHSGIVAGIVRLTAAGGCAGVSAFVRATGFPFHPFRSDGTRHLKFDVYCTRMIRQRKLRRTAAQNPYPRQGKGTLLSCERLQRRRRLSAFRRRRQIQNLPSR